MDPFSHPLPVCGAPLHKPGIENAIRHVTEGAGNAEDCVITVQRVGVMIHFDATVLYCLRSMLRPSVSDCYRWLKSIVWRDYGSHSWLPSESTFRRRVNRERVKIAAARAAARKAARLAKRSSPNFAIIHQN